MIGYKGQYLKGTLIGKKKLEMKQKTSIKKTPFPICRNEMTFTNSSILTYHQSSNRDFDLPTSSDMAYILLNLIRSFWFTVFGVKNRANPPTIRKSHLAPCIASLFISAWCLLYPKHGSRISSSFFCQQVGYLIPLARYVY